MDSHISQPRKDYSPQISSRFAQTKWNIPASETFPFFPSGLFYNHIPLAARIFFSLCTAYSSPFKMVPIILCDKTWCYTRQFCPSQRIHLTEMCRLFDHTVLSPHTPRFRENGKYVWKLESGPLQFCLHCFELSHLHPTSDEAWG